MLGLSIALFALLGYGAWRRAERSVVPQRVTLESATPKITVPSSVVAVAPAAPMPIEPAPRLVESEPPPAPPAASIVAAAPSVEPTPTGSVPAKVPQLAAALAPGPTPAQVHAALVATPIVMFTASWCSVCRRAHAFLRANGLSCTDRDIDADPAALRELKQRSGSASVPTFEIDGELERPGFSERQIEHALARSVERRLGVSGVSIQR